ncbi:hypothetical protein, partial [Pseudomonas syringae]|uniref:hypothetical protein n=1 Tax=Pseudomonas syringae TaxID=317 RepID=UPI001F247B2B
CVAGGGGATGVRGGSYACNEAGDYVSLGFPLLVCFIWFSSLEPKRTTSTHFFLAYAQFQKILNASASN